jgi:hypothetical protein
MKNIARLALATLILTSLLACSDAYNSFFGCKPDLISTVPSPDGKYKAVTRVCGCSADVGRHLSTAIVHSNTQGSCHDLKDESLAISWNNTDKSSASVLWQDNRTLEVKYSAGTTNINNEPLTLPRRRISSSLAPRIVGPTNSL